MSPAIESNVEGAWVAKQTAKGSPASSAIKRGRKVGGDINVNRDDGSENFSDGSRLSNADDFVNSIIGNGNPVLQGQSGVLAYLAYLMCGQETVSPAGTNEVQTVATTGVPTGGTVTLKLTNPHTGKTEETATIAYNATAATVQTALENLANVEVGDVTCAGGPLTTAGVTVTFAGRFAKLNMPAIVLGTNALTGGASPSVTITETTPGVTAKHTITPAAASFWTTWWKRVGTSVILRQKFNDSRLVSIRIEGSSANKIVKVTPTFISLDSGEVFTTDPTQDFDPNRPFLFTEGESTFKIDGVTIRGQSAFAFTITDNATPWYGDAVTPHDVVFGVGSVDLEAITMIVDQAGKDQYDKIIYNTTAPASGTKPVKTVAFGAYEFNLTRTDGQALKSEFPNVKWSPDIAIAGNPDGGAVEIPLGAQTRKPGSDPHIRLTIDNQDAAYT